MPRDPDKDGLTEHGRSLCERKSFQRVHDDCIPMTRMYFTQYQYMPFYMGSLAILYYIPYILFRSVNSDIIALRRDITPASGNEKSTEKSAVHIANTYFKYSRNGGVHGLRFRILLHTCVKILYLVVNCCGVWFTNKLLNYRYTNYGLQWMRWAELNNTVAYHFASNFNTHLVPKPGDYLLPTVGFCDVTEGYHDNLDVHNNNYKTICEISPHVLYQYVFLVLWFVFVGGIAASLTGVTQELLSVLTVNARALILRGKHGVASSLFEGCGHLTFREVQYLTLIRSKNDIMYRDIVELVRGDKSV